MDSEAIETLDAVPEGAVLVATMYAPLRLDVPTTAMSKLLPYLDDSAGACMARVASWPNGSAPVRPVAVDVYDVPGGTEVEVLDPREDPWWTGEQEFVVDLWGHREYFAPAGSDLPTTLDLNTARRWLTAGEALAGAREMKDWPFARVLPVRVTETPTRRVRHTREVK